MRRWSWRPCPGRLRTIPYRTGRGFGQRGRKLTGPWPTGGVFVFSGPSFVVFEAAKKGNLPKRHARIAMEANSLGASQNRFWGLPFALPVGEQNGGVTLNGPMIHALQRAGSALKPSTGKMPCRERIVAPCHRRDRNDLAYR